MSEHFVLSVHYDSSNGAQSFCLAAAGGARVTSAMRNEIAELLPEIGPKPKFDVKISAAPERLVIIVTRRLFRWGEWNAFTDYCENLRISLENWILDNA